MKVCIPLEFACLSPACAPPPAGTGGSAPKGGSGGVTADQRQSLLHYVHGRSDGLGYYTYAEVNASMRGTPHYNPRIQEGIDETVSNITAAIAASPPTTQPTTVHRVLSRSAGETTTLLGGKDPATLVGSTFTEQSFMSTASERSGYAQGASFKGAVEVTIKVPTGTRRLDIDALDLGTIYKEQEMVFAPGKTLRFTAYKYDKSYKIHTLEAEMT